MNVASLYRTHCSHAQRSISTLPPATLSTWRCAALHLQKMHTVWYVVWLGSQALVMAYNWELTKRLHAARGTRVPAWYRPLHLLGLFGVVIGMLAMLVTITDPGGTTWDRADDPGDIPVLQTVLRFCAHYLYTGLWHWIPLLFFRYALPHDEALVFTFARVRGPGHSLRLSELPSALAAAAGGHDHASDRSTDSGASQSDSVGGAGTLLAGAGTSAAAGTSRGDGGGGDGDGDIPAEIRPSDFVATAFRVLAAGLVFSHLLRDPPEEPDRDTMFPAAAAFECCRTRTCLRHCGCSSLACWPWASRSPSSASDWTRAARRLACSGCVSPPGCSSPPCCRVCGS